MRPRLVSSAEDDAPRAMPSVAACMTKPSVVEILRDLRENEELLMIPSGFPAAVSEELR